MENSNWGRGQIAESCMKKKIIGGGGLSRGKFLIFWPMGDLPRPPLPSLVGKSLGYATFLDL